MVAAVDDGTPAERQTRKPSATAAPPGSAAPERPAAFPIVGIGASAGGLEALEQFLSAVPPGCGMAFVIVQHLDPTHKGIMPELLQRGTRMPVEQVTDRVAVAPNHVYVIPPNKDLSLLGGALHLFAPVPPRGLRLPIDFFFRSLADDQRERSIGILLSGMGSDGTLGLRAIKEQAGIALVQDPATARFDGMPRSAIDAGLADIVASPEALCARLMAYLRRTPHPMPAKPDCEDQERNGLDKVVILLRTHTGHDFAHYKKNTLYRRIERRMRLHQLDRISQYVRYLQENLQERGLLFRELLIGVTSFFRDPEAWLHLREKIVPALLAAQPASGTLRAWVAGCSTGEEAYSLGILFREAVEALRLDQDFSLQIFATDLDGEAINRARLGVYPLNITADVSPERLRRFFVKEDGGGYRIGKEIREMVVFAQQNLIQDPPFTKIDLLICRNLLIYLDSDMQHRLLTLFHYSLNSSGVLFLGSAETASGPLDLFSTLDGKWRFFRREGAGDEIRPLVTVNPLPLPPPLADGGAAQPPASLQTAVEQLLLARFAPAAVLVMPQGDIVYISGRTGKYLEPPMGRTNWNIFAMAREGLREELLTVVQQALHQLPGEPFNRLGLRIKTNGDYQAVNLTALALHEPPVLRGTLLLVFAEAPPPKRRGRRMGSTSAGLSVAALELEVKQLRETLQNTREAMQSSQEELQSSNEELQSTNEELQSTNEELTTSKEEMQSLNEELQTVNMELQSKVDDLSRVNDDMKNLLDSTGIAALFLDDGLRVRRFTSRASELIKLIPSDIGRPVTDIASQVLYPDLTADVAQVLRTLMFAEKAIPADGGRWFNVRIMPYRTLDNRIDGVVVTFLDSTPAKQLEADLFAARRELERLRAGAGSGAHPDGAGAGS